MVPRGKSWAGLANEEVKNFPDASNYGIGKSTVWDEVFSSLVVVLFSEYNSYWVKLIARKKGVVRDH